MPPLSPGSTIGILGGGQLGRMQALAAARLGFKCHIYNDTSGPAWDVAAATTLGRFDDEAALNRFAGAVDVVTYEFENVPVAAAAAVERIVPVRPGLRALQVSQDRLAEKRFVFGLGLPVAPFASIDGPQDLEAALRTVTVPAILKTRRMGYDGKGQARVATASELRAKLAEIGSGPATLEAVVDFTCEVSVVLVRGLDGATRFYDIPVNCHEGGILRTSAVPCALPAAHQERAREIAATIATALDYVGVLAVEMFYTGDADRPLIVNEFAPRVHNSGHWTIDACAVSQFENHVRAVAGWPLGPTERHSDAVMQNLIGADAGNWAHLAAEPGACLHLYGKGEARPGRKMGHVTWIKPRDCGPRDL
jgi:5-(carboxyamino)imidazole ribonucleotide synthase